MSHNWNIWLTIYIYVYIYIYICIYIYVYICTYIIYVYIYVYIYIYVYMYVYIYVYMYVYIYYKMLLHHWLDPCRVAAAESVQPRWWPRPGEKNPLGMGDQWDTLWLCQNSYGTWPFSSLIYPLKIVDLSIVMGQFTRGYRLNMNGIYIYICICIYIYIYGYPIYIWNIPILMGINWYSLEWNMNGISMEFDSSEYYTG